MWSYKELGREDFEKVKDRVEKIMVAHGRSLLRWNCRMLKNR